MTKQAFINDLKLSLFGVNDSVREEILADINEHFIEGAAQGLSEEEICRSLGQPGTIAAQVMEEMGSTPPPQQERPRDNFYTDNDQAYTPTEVDETFSNISDLKIDLEVSKLRLQPSENGMFRVTITNLTDRDKHSIEDRNGTLRISVKRKKRLIGFVWGSSTSPEVRVYVPAQFNGKIKVESAAGSIHAHDTSGDLNFESAAGKIVVDNHRCSNVKFAAAAGSIKADFADSVLEEAKFESAAGSVKVEAAEIKHLKVDSAAGSCTVSVKRLGGAKIESAAGSATLTAYEVAGDIKVASAVGSVNINLPADANIRIEAEKPSMGKLQNNIQGNPQSPYVLRAESSLGSIRINAI